MNEDTTDELARLQRELSEARRKLRETEAQLIHNYHCADAAIDKASTAHLMASGVILSLVAIGGREIVAPVCIRDGLSQPTIDAIKNDLRRSYEMTASRKPKGC